MIYLKSLRLSNFLSHEDTEIEFKENVKLLLDGVSGAGKSTIFDAIVFALYGEGRAVARSLVRKGSEKAVVTLELVEEDGVSNPLVFHKIVRTITATGKHTLVVFHISSEGVVTADPLTGIRELQEWIEKKLIGASYLLFINSVAYVQGNADNFIGQTAARRKEILLELVNADNYEIYYERSRERITELNMKRVALQREDDGIQMWFDEVEGRIKLKASIEADIDRLNPLVQKLEAKRDNATAELNALNGIEKSIAMWTDNVRKSTDVYESTAKLVKRLEASEKVIKETKVLPTPDLLEKSRKVEKERIELLSNKPVVRDHLQNIKNAESDIADLTALSNCPSGNDCPHQQNTIARISRLYNEIKKHHADLEEEKAALLAWQVKVENLPEATDVELLTRVLILMEDIKQLPEKRSSLQQFKDGLLYAEGELAKEKINLSPGHKAAMELVLKEAETSLKNARTNLQSLLTELQIVKELEQKSISVRRRQVEIRTEIKPLTKQLEQLLLIKDAFSSKGVKAIVVDYLLPRLEDQINAVLAKLSDFRIRLDTQKASADGESTVEGLWITVINGMGEELPYGCLSGGERVKITISITEAFASLQNCGFRLLDEAITALDDDSLEDLMESLKLLQSKYPQMLVISHIPAIKDMFETQSMCTKINGITTICKEN